jgi:hypothetical protein
MRLINKKDKKQECYFENVTELMLNKNILVSVYLNQVRVLHYVPGKGYCMMRPAQHDNVSCCTDTLSHFIDRLRTEFNHSNNNLWYLFESVGDFAQAVIDNGWE